MKKLFTSYQLWLVLTITLLITLIVICITFAANYQELEGYRSTAFQNTAQKQVITELTSRNAQMQTEQQASNTSDTLTTLITEYVKAYYLTDGGESGNDKARKVEKYVTYDVFEQMYNEMESRTTLSADERIATVPTVTNMMYQIEENNLTAKALMTIDITYYYPDRTTDILPILVKMDFAFDKTEKLWKISGVSTANITNQNKVWGK